MATIDSMKLNCQGFTVYSPDVFERRVELDFPGPYDASDWAKTPEDFRAELIEGHIVLSPAPFFDHQYLISLIYDQISPQAKKNDALVMLSPFDVKLSQITFLQPDLLYLTASRIKQIKKFMHGAPDVVIEIVSPSARKRDRIKKFNLYQKYKVPEYWLFDPVKQTAEFWVLEDGVYQAAEVTKKKYQSAQVPHLKLNLDLLWKEFENRPAR
jgi:Uma2 family endonuclease